METKIQDFQISDALEWEETFMVTGKAAALQPTVDPADDFQREDALYVRLQRGPVVQCRSLFLVTKLLPSRRPCVDYFRPWSCHHLALSFFLSFFFFPPGSYAAALAAAEEGEVLLKKHDLRYRRPQDYFAEMLKTDGACARLRGSFLFPSCLFCRPVALA